MKKLGLLLCATGTLILAACSATAANIKDLPERDARIIVEVDKNIDKLSEEGAKKTQFAVYNNIKAAATPNIRMLGHYTVLNNAFILEVNSNDIESIKSVPGVKSVTVDKMHWVREINQDGYIPLGEGSTGDAIDESKNISAETMNMPEDNNEGEGTLIAILDNEFHLRGYTGNPDDRDDGEAWNHEVYSPLDDDVAVKYTFDSIGEMFVEIDDNNKPNPALKAGYRESGKTAGQEGSMYYNNKVPFYYDYGGYTKIYGKRGTPQYDVHSDLSYHGSHVSSITSANAPQYKGIAPKAQLALMKVFTDYDAKGLGEKLGLSTHTGAYDTSVLDALEDCIKLKVDGINMSLGNDLNDFDSGSITMRTLSKLKANHILTSISAGNSGKTSYASSGAYANWMPESVETGIMSGYANNVDSMTIASGHPTKIFYENAFQIDNHNIAFEDQIVNKQGYDDDYEEEIRMTDIYHGDGLPWVYIPGFGTSSDYEGIDATRKVVIVNRGSTSFADKYATAVSKKARAIVIINNDPTASSFNFRCVFGDGFNPTIPCALVLYKDKPFFESKRSGTFTIIDKQVSDNPAKYTTSSFSSDGATFDLDLKPEITAPGDNIRGAVPEHAMSNIKKSDWFKPEYKNKCYQYLSGTSMSAPNFAGAQAVLTSQATAPVYRAAKQAGRVVTEEEQAQINAYKDTVNMRLMSTANPMNDYLANPEDNKKTLTSPRIQGAGMADIGGALRTDVYLEGLDLNGNKIGKSKIALRYSEDIAKGDLKLSFLAHNESEQAREYDVKLTVMRPAIAHPNDIVTKEYNFKGTVEKIDNFSGMKFYDPQLKRVVTAAGDVAFKDAFYAGKDIEYYATAEDYQFDQDNKIAIGAGTVNSKKTVIAKGYYYNSSTNGVSWDPLPSYTAQSTMDVVIDEVTGQTVTVNPGENTINVNPYSLSDERKNEILDVYEYGCMIEGYVTLTSKDGHEDLSIPYLGFYAGADKNPDASYEKVPVTEPFNFEKDPTKVYPSYLANDIAAALVGKDQANMESMIVAGYAESPSAINTDKVLTNDLAFNDLVGFQNVGTDPITGEYVDNAKDNIYVGGKNTNTMIIQQFILRSVKENFFTITNKETGKTVYTSALVDMLSGDTADRWALWKSHVNYLSGGYVAHRAYAIVPLYDETTGERFPSGKYELTFNYQLAATNTWVSKSYDMNIDSEAPVVSSIAQYRKDGANRVRIYLEDTKLSYAILGYNYVDVQYDATANKYYIDETKAFVDQCIEEVSEGSQTKRLYIAAGDFARGETGAIVHLNNEKSFAAGYTIVQGEGLASYHDFTVSADNKVSFVDTENGETVTINGNLKLAKFAATGEPIYEDPKPSEPAEEVEIPNSSAPSSSEPSSSAPAESSSEPAAPAKKGCKGALASVSAIIAIPALMGGAVLFLKRRKEGGK